MKDLTFEAIDRAERTLRLKRRIDAAIHEVHELVDEALKRDHLDEAYQRDLEWLANNTCSDCEGDDGR